MDKGKLQALIDSGNLGELTPEEGEIHIATLARLHKGLQQIFSELLTVSDCLHNAKAVTPSLRVVIAATFLKATMQSINPCCQNGEAQNFIASTALYNDVLHNGLSQKEAEKLLLMSIEEPEYLAKVIMNIVRSN